MANQVFSYILFFVVMLSLARELATVEGFAPTKAPSLHSFREGKSRRMTHVSLEMNDAIGEEEEDDDDDDESKIDGASTKAQTNEKLEPMEKAWRYAKKPLLSIGSKGATLTHGNSLRQLLNQHTVVKVKVNTRKFDGSLHAAFEHLCKLAEENGAPKGIEMLQAREGDKTIMFGLPGTAERIARGDFPPTAH